MKIKNIITNLIKNMVKEMIHFLRTYFISFRYFKNTNSIGITQFILVTIWATIILIILFKLFCYFVYHFFWFCIKYREWFFIGLFIYGFDKADDVYEDVSYFFRDSRY